jgi:hypothetical protein
VQGHTEYASFGERSLQLLTFCMQHEQEKAGRERQMQMVSGWALPAPLPAGSVCPGCHPPSRRPGLCECERLCVECEWSVCECVSVCMAMTGHGVIPGPSPPARPLPSPCSGCGWEVSGAAVMWGLSLAPLTTVASTLGPPSSATTVRVWKSPFSRSTRPLTVITPCGGQVTT